VILSSVFLFENLNNKNYMGQICFYVPVNKTLILKIDKIDIYKANKSLNLIMETKELSLCHKLKFSNIYIFAT